MMQMGKHPIAIFLNPASFPRVVRKITVSGWFAGKCLISGPDTLRPYKQENRNGGKILSVDLCSLRSYSQFET